MRFQHALTTAILLGGTSWCLWEQYGLSIIRDKHQATVAEAAALGLLSQSSETRSTRARNRSREQPSLGSAADFMTKLTLLCEELDGGPQKDDFMWCLMDLIADLDQFNQSEIEILMRKLCDEDSLAEDVRGQVLRFCVACLAEKHPAAALQALVDHATHFGANTRGSSEDILKHWGAQAPLEALGWIQQNGDRFKEIPRDLAEQALISGVAERDLSLALQVAAELHLSAESAFDAMCASAGGIQQQIELVDILKKHVAAMPDSEKREAYRAEALKTMFSRISMSGFDQSEKWLDNADLTQQDREQLVGALRFFRTGADTGKWLNWLGSRTDANTTSSTREHLVSEWTKHDYRAAGEWLAGAPPGPAKDLAVLAYAETVAPVDTDTAVLWVQTLPSSQSESALRRIHQSLKSKDAAAAREFAAKHGLANE